METNTVGQIIQKYREEAGLTQEELAEIIHVTKGKLVHWENNETIPRASMVGRLIGALDIPDDELINAVHVAQDKKILTEQKEREAKTTEEKAENEETQREYHKRRALTLLGLGVAGFIAGCLIVFFTESYKDTVWYFPIIIGVGCAGIPFGYKLLFGDSNLLLKRRRDPWEHEARYRRSMIEWVIVIVAYLFLFFIVWLIGSLTYPVVLLYHAYKAGHKKSAYRIIMFIIFLLAALFYGAIVFFLIMSASSS